MIDFVFNRPAIKQFVTTSFVLAVIFLILFFRNPLLFIYPVPHGEDLPQFLGQEYNIGFPKTAFILYAGYIHLLPRIIAWISLKFGWSDAMLVMNWIVLSIKILAFYLIYKSKVISSWYIKFCLIAYMVLVPFADEIYNNVTNLQWWLIPLMAVVFVRHENSVLSVLFSCCVLVLTGLTGVNSIMFAIPCAYMLFMVRTKICLVKSVIIVICALIQCHCLLSSPRMGNVAYETIYMMGGGWLINLINLFVNRVIYQTLFDFTSTNFNLNLFVFLCYISLLIFNLYFYRKNVFVRFIFLFSIVYFFSILYSLIGAQPNLEYFIKVTRLGPSCERYFVFLRICSIILLISSAEIFFKVYISHNNYKRVMSYSCFLLILLLLNNYPSGIQYFQDRSKYYADVEQVESLKPGEILTIHNTLDCPPYDHPWACFHLKKK